jgi:hypothetical protein
MEGMVTTFEPTMLDRAQLGLPVERQRLIYAIDAGTTGARM